VADSIALACIVKEAMAAKVSEKHEMKPLQQGLEDSPLDYYDIMVIGRTGMGKSTTVDKLLIARLPGFANEAVGADMAEERGAGEDWQERDVGPDVKQLQHDDLIMWLISDDQFAGDRVSMRLKNLVFFRSLENSHKEINIARDSDMHIYGSTSNCELLSNESTKIRVLDVPGFFGKDAAGEERDLHAMGQATQDTDLGVMRKILRIMRVHCLNFSRVVYFLPDKGGLKRTSQNLILEIGIMERYFGRAIFDNMVVVATIPSEIYLAPIPEDYDLFSDKRVFEKTKFHLQEAIERIFEGS
jgi:hypothetical protein